ncbi:MAG: heme exporter protein CcmD [Hyphomicrobiaceae bacterium]
MGKHAAFIWACYLVVAIGLGALIAWLIYDGRRLARRISDLEARGVRRRSADTSGNSPS